MPLITVPQAQAQGKMTAQFIRRRPRSKLTDDEKQIIATTAQQNQNLTHEQISALTGVERSTVTRVLKRYGIIRERVESFKLNRADIFAGMQERLLSSITAAEIKKMPPGSKILATAQLYDKEAIERGIQGDDKSRPLVVIVKGGNVQVNAGSAQAQADGKRDRSGTDQQDQISYEDV